MKFVIAALLVLLPQLSFADDYVAAVKQALKTNEEAVINSCLEYTYTGLEAKELRGQAKKDYATEFESAGYEDEDQADEQGLSAGSYQVGPHHLQVVTSMNDGNGFCSFYTKLGTYVGSVHGTESSPWTLHVP